MSDAQDALLTDVVLRGETAFVGAAGTVLAITLGVFGVLWFFYGFEQGWSLPAILNPALCIIITVAGLGMTLLSALVWYVWEDAMVLRANTAGLTASEMKRLLDAQPAPLVQIERLSGLMSFAVMMMLGLFAACLGWWAYQRRG